MSKIMIGLDEIALLIPHRDPMLFVHSIEIDVSGGTKKGLQAHAVLPPEVMEFWLQGLDRVFPSVLAVEVFAQVVGAAFLHVNPDYRGRLSALFGVENVAFVSVGDSHEPIDSLVTIVSANGKAFKARGQMFCKGKTMVTGDFTCGFID